MDSRDLEISSQKHRPGRKIVYLENTVLDGVLERKVLEFSVLENLD